MAEGQYKTAANLNARWDLYKFCSPPIDIYKKAFGYLKLTGNEKILEVGCGDGSVLLSLREEMDHQGELTGLEINNTITKPTDNYLSAHPRIKKIKFLIGSADNLTGFRNNSLDVILAFFMLYHMDDIPKTLHEWSRVMGFRGKLVVSTSSQFNRPQGKGLKLKMAAMMGAKTQAKFSEPFNLENGQSRLGQVFSVTKKVECESEIRITDPEVYLRSLDSTRDMYDPLPSDKTWQLARAYAQKTIQDEINDKGYFADPVKRGYFICEQVFLERQ